jgi:hypothetical protein
VLWGAHLVPADLAVPVRVDQSKGGLDKELKRDQQNLEQSLFLYWEHVPKSLYSP